MTRFTANTLLLTAAAIWGSAFVAQATAMDDIGPLYFSGIRFLIASLCVAPFAWHEARKAKSASQPPVSRRHYRSFVFLGLAFFFAIAIQQIGLVATTVINAGFLTALYVVLVPLLGLVAFREKPHVIAWPAAGTALGGIWLLGGGALTGGNLNWGDAAMVACAVFWAIHVGMIGRIGADSGRPLMLSLVQFMVVGVLGVGLGLVFEELSWAAIEGAAFELFYTSVISGGLAFTLQAVAQRWTRTADAAILLSSEALFGALFGAWLLGERLGPLGLVGCGLIFAAILAVQLVPIMGWARLRRA
ncbi:DMT family transporter [Breoghania sp. L-A4]|uniref:DMT family transporter n=1 Tax=Breoghania sp. L-A4 TaxID=2304600 RepID=UPI000E35B76E|nr:DMT family transporter [Breoghania sp. L-A4]AXS42060.1 DMT family transporter [Breoghania sp. L-A4]